MNGPLRIVYVIDSIGRGGTEIQLAELIRRLDRRRFRPALVTLRYFRPDVLPPDCPHDHLDVGTLLSPRGLAALTQLARRLRREQVDVVQTFFQDATVLGGVAARLAGVPVRLASFRDLGFWRTRGQELVLRRVYGLMTGFVANSPAVRDHFCERDGIAPDRVTVIPNGLDVDGFEFNPPRARPVKVGIVGNPNRPVKRFDLFVEAAGLLRARFPEARWEIVGDGALRPALEARAHDLGLTDVMTWHGRLADVRPVIADWDVGVLCSDSEGFSNALLEYMLAGCAPVATAVGGNLAALDEGRTGLLVPPGDASALAAALARLLEDGELTGRLAAAAAAEARATYAWPRCVAAHADLYTTSLARARR